MWPIHFCICVWYLLYSPDFSNQLLNSYDWGVNNKYFTNAAVWRGVPIEKSKPIAHRRVGPPPKTMWSRSLTCGKSNFDYLYISQYGKRNPIFPKVLFNLYLEILVFPVKRVLNSWNVRKFLIIPSYLLTNMSILKVSPLN